MLNHTYTSVKNANLVDCGKKQHISSQPFPLLKDNFLGEFRTELDKKKVLANLGIAADLSLEWANIKGNIGDNNDLINELNARTTYVTQIGDFQNSVISVVDGIKYLETIVGGEQEGEDGQNQRLTALETLTGELVTDLDEVKEYLTETIEVDIDKLEEDLGTITEKVNNITDLIQVSSKAGNALCLVEESELEEGETAGLYVPNLEPRITAAELRFNPIEDNIKTIQELIPNFVTKDSFGSDSSLDFVESSTFAQYRETTNKSISAIQNDLSNTVKTGEDGHVDTFYVNTISTDNGNIKITDSFEVTEGIPLDVRCVVNSENELRTIPVNVCYPGMGVIVKDSSSLFILRDPKDLEFNQEYIGNIDNWKCPEDLVTVPMSRSDYEALEKPSSHVFYYIYEDEYKLTHKPREGEYDNVEDYQNALKDWENQLKELDQQYLAASWGLEIENSLRTKASNESLNKLAEEVAGIKGGGEGASLESLKAEVEGLQTSTQDLEGRINVILTTSEDGTDTGRIVDLETSIQDINNNLDNYVTRTELTGEGSDDFKFVTKILHATDLSTLTEGIKASITTKEVITDKLSVTNSFTLNNNSIVSDNDRLKFNSNSLAFTDDLLNVEVLSQADYNKREANNLISEKTYYYTYDTETYLVTKETFDSLVEKVGRLEGLITELQKLIQPPSQE